MRFLFNDKEVLELALTLIFSVVSLGNQGSNEKDKIRTTLKNIMETILCMDAEKYQILRRNATHIGSNAYEESQVEEICQKDYYNLKLQHSYSYQCRPERV